MIYFQRISILNFPIAWILSLWRDVATWQLALPDVLGGRFKVLLPTDLFSRAEWLMLQQDAFDSFRSVIFDELSKHLRLTIRYRTAKYDFTLGLLQRLSIEFERFYLFRELAVRHNKKIGKACGSFYLILPWSICSLPNSKPSLDLDSTSIKYVRALAWIDALAEVAHSLAHIGWLLMRLIPRPCRQFGVARAGISIFWLGISKQEIPRNDGTITFAWPTQYGYLDKSSVLYFLPNEPADAERTYLAENGVRYLTPNTLLAPLTATSRIRIIGAVVRECFKAIVSMSGLELVYRPRFSARALCWAELANVFSPKAYITTTSYSWPERYEVPVMCGLNIRTVIWAYSANSLRYIRETNKVFDDRSVERCLLMADEFWIWNEAWIRWLEKRRVPHIDNHCTPRVIGAMMCGNPKHLEKSAKDVRESLGLKKDGFYLAVFDLPTTTIEWRKKFASGPGIIETPFLNEFYKGIIQVINEFQDIVLVIKPKRDLHRQYFESGDVFKELLKSGGNGLSERVHLLDWNIDPYIPIAMCDAAVAVPFTSPVLVALASGRHATYYDPIGNVGYCPEPDLMQHVVQGQQSLIETVASWKSGSIEPEHNKTRGKCYSPNPDAALRTAFRDLLS
ncbi:MAG: polysaccharide biosynthesis PFTS motif protein [Deltaproteobacteria bacterium]|nr:polysaccharide biosynthesis PFTS motif protein [Deltaproteobacteria bacterium]